MTEPPAEPGAPPTRRARLRRARLISARRPLMVLFLAGAIFGLVLVTVSTYMVAQRDVSQTLVAFDDAADADVRVGFALSSIDAQAGEANLRLVPIPLGDDRVQGGLVTQGFRVFVNDLGGENTYTFAAGQPLRSIDFTVALSGGSVFEYPFDRYDAAVLVLAAEGTDTADGEPLVIDASVTSSLLAFDVSARYAEECQASGTTCLALEVRRPVSTVGYGVWFIVLVWALALAGVGVLYVVMRRGIELPLWAFGYLVGVLFALPPLRSSLPSTPPVGGFIDFVAYYWALAVIGVTLIAFIGLWIRENRRLDR